MAHLAGFIIVAENLISAILPRISTVLIIRFMLMINFSATAKIYSKEAIFIRLGYQFNQFYGLQIAWHDISNHAPEVSEIVIDYNGEPIDYETRFKIVTQINF